MRDQHGIFCRDDDGERSLKCYQKIKKIKIKQDEIERWKNKARFQK